MPIRFSSKPAEVIEEPAIQELPVPDLPEINEPDKTAELVQKLQEQNQSFLDSLAKQLTQKTGKKTIVAEVIRGTDGLIQKITMEVE